LDKQEADVALEKTYVLTVRVVDVRSNPIKNVNVKVFKLEKSLTLEQWTENLKNGSPFKRLAASLNSDEDGTVTAMLTEGSYEVDVEKYRLIKVCELTKNDSVVFIEPKKRWWQ
jgi:hypothetical protein